MSCSLALCDPVSGSLVLYDPVSGSLVVYDPVIFVSLDVLLVEFMYLLAYQVRMTVGVFM